jgi:hypothetical protein
MSIENVILANLLHNEKYTRAVLPFLKAEYFSNAAEKIVFEKINDFVTKYSINPSKEALAINISQSGLNEGIFEEVLTIVKGLEPDDNHYKWLYEESEQFCKKQSLFLAMYKAIDIAEGNDKDTEASAIPGMLMEALSVSFDSHVGHDYWEDTEAHWQALHSEDARLAFSLPIFNRVTKGGIKNKTLNCVAGEEEFELYIDDPALLDILIKNGAALC